jgi:hypothetical protein
MKPKMILVAALMFAFAGDEAKASPPADLTCSLSIHPGPVIGVGQSYSYGLDITNWVDFGPLPATTVVFFGTKNGVSDIPPSGELYPAFVNYTGHSELGGYQNPGGISGFYVRYAVLFRAGQFYCATNPVTVVLQ